MLFIGRNLLTRDYTHETKTFLTSIGRADAIEKVVPKTMEDVQKERKKQISTFDQLVANMTLVMSQYQGLRAEIDEMKGKAVSVNLPSAVTPITTVPPVITAAAAARGESTASVSPIIPPVSTKYLNLNSN